MKRSASVVALALALLCSSFLFAAEKPLTNSDVISLVKAGLDDGTIVAKIRQSGRSGFDTSVDGLIALKKANVSKTVIDAMLGAAPVGTGTGGAAPAGTGGSTVQLVTADGELDLQSLEGEPSATYIGVGFLTWLNFDAPHASVRTKDQSFSLRLRSAERPESRFFIVKLESNDDDRSVKMGRSRMFSATAATTPDREWTIPFDSVQEGDGIWRLTPKKAMTKGEYGLLRGAELYDFAVE